MTIRPKYLLFAALIFFLAARQCEVSAARIVIDSIGRADTTRKSTFQDIDANFLENYTSIANIDASISSINSALNALTIDNPESWAAFSAGDATPSVATYFHFSLADTTTITTFDDPTDGKHIWVYCGYPAQFDVTDSGITAHNRTTDLTATAGAVFEFIYDATLTKWIAVNMPDESTSTLSSAEMRDIYTDESGDGAALFQNGNLGVPEGGDLSNCTNAVPADNTISEAKLQCTNSPVDGDIPTYDSGSGGFTWEANSGGGSATYDAIPDATASGTIDIGAYTVLHDLDTSGAMRWGTATDYFEVINDAGVITVRLGGAAICELGTYTIADEGAAIQTGTATGDWATILQAYNGSVYVPLLRAYNNTTPYAEFGPPTNNLKVDSTGAIEFQGAATLTNLKCQQFPVEIGLAISDESTDLTTGTAKVTIRAPYAFTLTGVRASVNTAPVGSGIAIDVNEAGVSVFSTVLTIDAGEETSTTAATAAVISDSAIADDAELTFDIDQIGSTTAGKGAKIWLIGYRSI